MRLLFAAFFVAHAAVHTGFVSRRPPPRPGAPAWPFDLDRSWILSRLGIGSSTTRTIGITLLAALIAAYSVGSLATVGVIPSVFLVSGIVAGSVLSLILIALFFHVWLVIGAAIDMVLLWAVLLANWSPLTIGS